MVNVQLVLIMWISCIHSSFLSFSAIGDCNFVWGGRGNINEQTCLDGYALFSFEAVCKQFCHDKTDKGNYPFHIMPKPVSGN